MFKFDEYPEIKKAHEIDENYNKEMNLAYKAVEEHDFDENYKAKYFEIRQKQDDYSFNVYAKIIHNTFNPIKPDLRYVWDNNRIEKWDSVISDDFENCDDDQKRLLWGLVEEEDPYILPAEYYNGKTKVELYFEEKARSQE